MTPRRVLAQRLPEATEGGHSTDYLRQSCREGTYEREEQFFRGT